MFSWPITDNVDDFCCFCEPFAYLCVAGLVTSLVAQISTQGDTGSHQSQAEQGLQ